MFDLDNTLYPATTCMFDKIDVRMGAYIAICWAATMPRRGACRRCISTITAPRPG
jgi:FMN phosphatase YigB (HAD superfamily)